MAIKKKNNFFVRLCYGYVGKYKDTSKMTTQEVIDEFLKSKGVSSPREFFQKKFKVNKLNNKEKITYNKMTDRKSVNDFFWYDGEERGLLAKIKSSHSKWDRSLTSTQRSVLNDYTSDGYSNINSYLRGYDNKTTYSIDEIKYKISNIDKAIESYFLREPITTYRSINSWAFVEYLDNFETLIGEKYTDRAFMSSSPTLDSPALNKDLLMTINLPKGKGIGAYIDGYNGLNETEFLIKRDSVFIITNAYKKGDLYYIEMELVIWLSKKREKV